MDLIGQLAGQLGIEEKQAQALAGTVIGGVQNAVKDEEGGEQKAAEIAEAVPELGDWKSQAGDLLGGGGEASQGGMGGLLGAAAGALGGGGQSGGGMGGLLGAAAGALGGQEAKDTVAVVAVLSEFDVEPGKAALVAPLILNFLKSRVKPGTLQTILAVAPMLAAALDKDDDDKGEGGGLGGVLGGLLG
ncbi:MAG: hypothetical protein VX899_12065 [Myxococcota bacterium]|nr:hypothetical protein [Myxococcota bacterium]